MINLRPLDAQSRILSHETDHTRAFSDIAEAGERLLEGAHQVFTEHHAITRRIAIEVTARIRGFAFQGLVDEDPPVSQAHAVWRVEVQPIDRQATSGRSRSSSGSGSDEGRGVGSSDDDESVEAALKDTVSDPSDGTGCRASLDCSDCTHHRGFH